MQREIKFRAWDKMCGSMREPITMMPDGSFDLSFGQCHADDRVRPDYEIMQFTGLRDKNGKEIYEGDIVRKPGTPIIGEIYYAYDWCRWEWGHMGAIIDGDSCFLNLHDGKTIYEVIGNIHQNPELLK